MAAVRGITAILGILIGSCWTPYCLAGSGSPIRPAGAQGCASIPAGSYGDLTLTEDGWFSRSIMMDVMPDVIIRGRYVRDGPKLVLLPLFGGRGMNLMPDPVVVVCLPWGSCTLLVAEEDMLYFVNAFNADPETAAGRWFRCSDGGRPTLEDVPAVPEPWRGYLLATPLVGKVLRKLKDDAVIIDLGSDAGVCVGMQFIVPLHGGTTGLSFEGYLRVTAVDSKTSVASYRETREWEGDSVDLIGNGDTAFTRNPIW